jgi:hypothetical protein
MDKILHGFHQKPLSFHIAWIWFPRLGIATRWIWHFRLDGKGKNFGHKYTSIQVSQMLPTAKGAVQKIGLAIEIERGQPQMPIKSYG